MTIPSDTVSLYDYERYFHQRVDPAIRAYISGAAADGITWRDNRAAFDRIRLRPRALADLSQAGCRTRLFGRDMPTPIVIAPMAYHRLAHDEGERATAAAAELTQTIMTVSTLSSLTLEEVAEASRGPLWFQLYCQPRAEDSLTLIRRAETAGYQALVITIDAPISGIRNMEQRAGFRLPEGIGPVNLADFPAEKPHPVSGMAGSILQGMARHAPTWGDIERLCAQTRLPVLLKGVMSAEDVAPALAAGAAGLVVSNHAGRTLDTLPAAIDVLPEVVRQVAGRVPVLMDGGIRRGTDILKAIALGAEAVMVGQPVLHALAVGGTTGVAHMLAILRTELEAAMVLTGRPRLTDIDRSVLFEPWRPSSPQGMASPED